MQQIREKMDLIDLEEDAIDAEVLDSYHPPSEHSYRSVPHLNIAESAAHGYLHGPPRPPSPMLSVHAPSVVGSVTSQVVKTINDTAACLRWCILAPTNARVDLYNPAVLNLLPSTAHQYHAADSLKEHTEVAEVMNSGSDNNSPLPNPDAVLDYVRHRRPSRMPDYSLMVKVGGVYRLLRNFSIDLGLGEERVSFGDRDGFKIDHRPRAS